MGSELLTVTVPPMSSVTTGSLAPSGASMLKPEVGHRERAATTVGGQPDRVVDLDLTWGRVTVPEPGTSIRPYLSESPPKPCQTRVPTKPTTESNISATDARRTHRHMG